MEKCAVLLIALLMISGCATTGTTTLSTKDVIKADAQRLLAAANWAAPIASVVVAAFAPNSLPAMNMASASLGTLNTLVNKAATTDQVNAALAATQQAWSGIDSAYQNRPNAQAQLLAVQVAVNSAKALIDGGVNPVPLVAQ